MIIFILPFCIYTLQSANLKDSLINNQKYYNIPAAIHMDSTISGGKYSIGEIKNILKKDNVPIGIITDHDNMKVEYGMFPLRNIIKKSVGENSILKFGADNYIKEIERFNEKNMILIHGTEAVPFYYWEGSYFNGNLKLRNWHEHLLVIGLKNKNDYESLPSIANGFKRVFSPLILLNIIPLITLLIGILLLKVKRKKEIVFRNQTFIISLRPYKIPAILVIIISILFIINNFPFIPHKYDQYHGDMGAKPYQELIDYVNKRGGMAFWAHPEVENRGNIYGIEYYTAPYYNHLLETDGYTGFAAFWEGMKFIGKPGGIWDRILIDYCNGKRKKPVWAIGELDFEEGNISNVRETSTFLLLRKKTREDALDALKNGRMYATRSFASQFLSLDEFSINEIGNMGDKIKAYKPVQIRIKIRVLDRKKRKLKLEIINMGKIIKDFYIDNSSEIVYNDKPVNNGLIYYRIAILNDDFPILISNPIFVKVLN